jgi:lipopolysaccharide export system permease protein
MYWTLAYKIGGQPIGALEKGFAVLGKSIRSLFIRKPPNGMPSA